jgi:hypothetical protein
MLHRGGSGGSVLKEVEGRPRSGWEATTVKRKAQKKAASLFIAYDRNVAADFPHFWSLLSHLFSAYFFYLHLSVPLTLSFFFKLLAASQQRFFTGTVSFR